jgi:hypothetical protein
MTNNNASTGRTLRRWMRAVGAFYLVQALMMIVVRAPIRTFGPKGALAKADAGDPVAKFVIDTWTTFGFEVAAVGVALLAATRRPELAKGVVATVLAIEVGRGLLLDTYMIARGIHVGGYLVWIAIHSTVLATGLRALRTERTGQDQPAVGWAAAS